MNYIPTIMVNQPAPVLPPNFPAITFPAPLSYDFRVVEYVEMNKITKVRMEVKINQHDQFGNIMVTGSWEEVSRIQINLDAEPL